MASLGAYKRSLPPSHSSLSVDSNRAVLRENNGDFPDPAFISSLYDSLTPASDSFLHDLLIFQSLTVRPDLAFRVLEVADLLTRLIPCLAEPSIDASVCSAVFSVLSNIAKIPGILPEFVNHSIFQILDPLRLKVTRSFRTADRELIFEFLRLLRRLARPPIVAAAFQKYIIFLRFCIDEESLPALVTRAFSVAHRITVLDFATCECFLSHDFLSPAFRYMKKCAGEDDGKLFRIVCAFASRLTVDEIDAVPHFPRDFVVALTEILERITVEQARPFRAFLRGVALNLDLLPLLFVPEFVGALIRVSESREFTVARAAVDVLIEMLGFAPERLCGSLVEHGSLDFLVRFTETRDGRLIQEMLIGLSALACKCMLVNQENGALLALFENSPGILELAEEIENGGEGCEFDVTEDMEEAVAQLLQAVRSGLGSAESDPSSG
jgi:hypothetical protein